MTPWPWCWYNYQTNWCKFLRQFQRLDNVIRISGLIQDLKLGLTSKSVFSTNFWPRFTVGSPASEKTWSLGNLRACLWNYPIILEPFSSQQKEQETAHRVIAIGLKRTYLRFLLINKFKLNVRMVGNYLLYKYQ